VPLVDSLLAAIVREDGESLVLHVGERPIVVAAGGPVEVASATLTLQAMDALLTELGYDSSHDADARWTFPVAIAARPEASVVSTC